MLENIGTNIPSYPRGHFPKPPCFSSCPPFAESAKIYKSPFTRFLHRTNRSIVSKNPGASFQLYYEEHK